MPHVRKTKRLPSVSHKLKIVMLACLGIATALTLMGVFMVQQERMQQAAAEAASYTPAPLPSSAPVETVAVIGDSYTGGSDEGGLDAANWVPLAEAELQSDAADVVMNPEAAGGSGYVNPGPTDTTFGQIVPTVVNAGTDVVVFFGSRNDMNSDPQAVADAATAAYAEAKAIAPEAVVLVIGAPWVSADVPPEIRAVNTALAEAASAAGATFVNPVDEGWFFDKPDLIGADGVHPTDAGHAYLKYLIVPHIESALALR